MSEKKIKAKSKNQEPKFESPLASYLKAYCKDCEDWKKCCDTITEKGVDRMFLCMTAASIQSPVLESDPHKIVDAALRTLSELGEGEKSL